MLKSQCSSSNISAKTLLVWCPMILRQANAPEQMLKVSWFNQWISSHLSHQINSSLCVSRYRHQPKDWFAMSPYCSTLLGSKSHELRFKLTVVAPLSLLRNGWYWWPITILFQTICWRCEWPMGAVMSAPPSGKKWNFLDKWADKHLQDQIAGPVSLVPWSPFASLLTVHLLADVWWLYAISTSKYKYMTPRY